MTNTESYCGLDCEACDAFVATKTCDNQLMAQVAQRWSKLYDMKIEARDVYCKGCKSLGTQGIYCQSMCRIKPCCRDKGLDTCAPCSEFPCADLKKVFDFCPEAKKRLMKN
ncbi:MAG: DUF3795 domain-containing protein [Desulfobacterales bacterium]|nr:DUF3795 domain-containing protein [Desulfobacterales bacterium]